MSCVHVSEHYHACRVPWSVERSIHVDWYQSPDPCALFVVCRLVWTFPTRFGSSILRSRLRAVVHHARQRHDDAGHRAHVRMRAFGCADVVPSSFPFSLSSPLLLVLLLGSQLVFLQTTLAASLPTATPRWVVADPSSLNVAGVSAAPGSQSSGTSIATSAASLSGSMRTACPPAASTLTTATATPCWPRRSVRSVGAGGGRLDRWVTNVATAPIVVGGRRSAASSAWDPARLQSLRARHLFALFGFCEVCAAESSRLRRACFAGRVLWLLLRLLLLLLPDGSSPHPAPCHEDRHHHRGCAVQGRRCAGRRHARHGGRHSLRQELRKDPLHCSEHLLLRCRHSGRYGGRNGASPNARCRRYVLRPCAKDTRGAHCCYSRRHRRRLNSTPT